MSPPIRLEPQQTQVTFPAELFSVIADPEHAWYSLMVCVQTTRPERAEVRSSARAEQTADVTELGAHP